MRQAMLIAAAVGLATPALADMDRGQMDLLEGPYALTADDGARCSLTLGDRPVDGGRHLDGGPGCRSLDPLFARATGWRIDTSKTLVILGDGGKALLSMRFVSADETFRTSADRVPALVLAPAE